MHLYDCRVGTFIPQATSGQIADVLRERFIDRLDQRPSPGEVTSWRNSLGAFAEAIDGVAPDDAWIVLEYQLPLASSRVDCMLIGTDRTNRSHDVLLEFKQWDSCAPTGVPEVVMVGGVLHLHPSAQVRSYRDYLQDSHSAFSDGGIALSSCSYLHNVRGGAGCAFFDPMFSDLLADSPAFSVDTVDDLARYVGERIYVGADNRTVESILSGRYQPSKRLLDHVADSIQGHEPWRLLDEQLIAYHKIFADIEAARRTGEKRVVIVVGGPGTGKSVIALQVVGAAARRGWVVIHATGSKAFTTNLRGLVGRTEPFRYFMDIAKASPNSLDLVVCDEAHRLRERSDTRYAVISNRPQHEDVIDAARVSVFLLDRQQSVRTNEVGSVEAIQDYARSRGIPVSHHDLRTQFRCAGSDSYVRWIDYVLGLSGETSTAWLRNNEYEVRIFDSPAEMECALRTKMAVGYSARLVAGFCWEWSDPLPTGERVADVRIGDWHRPWNRKPRDMWRKRVGSPERPSEHPYKVWANEPRGFDEIGCIYSAQGLEFDYVGVIFGSDLQWNDQAQTWVPALQHNRDRGFQNGLGGNRSLALEKLKHIYRVLSTRGMKGTYFYFLHEGTRRHFEELMAGSSRK